MPRDPDGDALGPDGTYLRDLSQSVTHFGVAAHTLRQLYADSIGALLTPEDAAELGVAVRPKVSAPTAANRVLSEQDIQLLADNNLLPPREHERAMFLQMCERTGLDPLRKQIYWCYRKDAARKQLVFSVELNIGGLRTLAQRTGELVGTKEPLWSGDGEKWLMGWADANNPPALAKYGVKRKGREEYTWGVARWDAYAVRFIGDQTGEIRLAPHWAKMSDHMLLKCAEALAYRSAWPELFSGLYIGEEMEQSENPLPPAGDALTAQPETNDSQVTNEDDSQIDEPAKMPQVDPGISDEELIRSLGLLGLEDVERRTAINAYRGKWSTLYQKNRGQFNRLLLKTVKNDPSRYKLRATV